MRHGVDQQVLTLMMFHAADGNDLVPVWAGPEPLGMKNGRVEHVTSEVVEPLDAVADHARVSEQAVRFPEPDPVGRHDGVS